MYLNLQTKARRQFLIPQMNARERTQAGWREGKVSSYWMCFKFEVVIRLLVLLRFALSVVWFSIDRFDLFEIRYCEPFELL